MIDNNSILLIDNAENEDDLDRQWSNWNMMTYKNRKVSDSMCLSKYGMTNLDRYNQFKSNFNKEPADYVELDDPEVLHDTIDNSDPYLETKTITKKEMISELNESLLYNPYITEEEAVKNGGFYDRHGIWNSILKLKNDPTRLYRGRVECLIIKGNMIYLCKRPTDEYRLPGGSFEIANDNETQCYNECKEEARILVKNIKNSGIVYTKTYSRPADWTMDLPIQWTGQYIEVYVADFDKYYNGNVDINDRDEDMYSNGRFYNIDEVYGILRDEHKRAIDKCVRNINIKEYTVEVAGGVNHINTDVGKPNPLDNITDEMYAAAKEWSDRTGIAMILRNYTIEDLQRNFLEFMSMTYYYRKVSNQESIRIFGFNNIDHYNYQKNKLLKDDETDIDIEDIVNSDDDSTSTISEGVKRVSETQTTISKRIKSYSEGKLKDSYNESFNLTSIVSDRLKRKMDIITEEVLYDKSDKIAIGNMLYDLKCEQANFAEKCIVNKFAEDTNKYINKDFTLLPYYTPNEMIELGTCNEDSEENFYKVSSDNKAKEWFSFYERTGVPGYEWYKSLSEAYNELIKNPSDINKQKVLDYGWNPEIQFDLDTVRETSILTKKKLGNRYKIDVINITEALNDLEYYKEIAYIPKNINKYNLSSYLLRSIEMEHTIGRIFVDYNDNYVAHITIYNDIIQGIGSWYKGPELLSELITWAIEEKNITTCYCRKDDTKLMQILEKLGFTKFEDNDYTVTYKLSNNNKSDILEASSVKSKEKLNPIYIVTTYTESPFGKTIKRITHDAYTHAALGFDSALKKLYSFNMSHSNGKFGGLSVESVDQYVNDSENADLNVAVVYLNGKDYKTLKSRLDMYLLNVHNTSYSVKNIFNIAINRAENTTEQFSMVCSQFVDSMLKTINVDITGKPSNLVTPGDLSRVSNPKVYKVYEGKAKAYNPKRTDAILSKLVGTALPIDESTFLSNASMGIYYIQPVLEVKEFPVGFDDDGSLLIKNYKKLDYDAEYMRSNKLMKSYKANKNWHAMSYELCRIWFINTVLLKKIETEKDDEEKARLVKIRAKFMNDFTIYLNEVNRNVKDFNFSEYYERTPFSNTVIKISGSTIKYTGRYLKDLITFLAP